MESMSPDYDPYDMVKRMVAKDEGAVQLAVFHPGYLDDYILSHSSLTLPRTKEVAVLTDEGFKKWLIQQDVELIDYRDL